MRPNVDDEQDDLIEFNFEFELLNSDDGKIVTLVCSSDRILEPNEYAMALREFANRIETILTMSEVESGPLN